LCSRTNNTRKCLNLGSYNYLGFASHDEYCTPHVVEALEKFATSTCASQINGGSTVLHEELEQIIAKFVGKPAAMVYGMGFATNSTTIPVLVGKVGIAILISVSSYASSRNISRSLSKASLFLVLYVVATPLYTHIGCVLLCSKFRVD
jgi:7-keto-8-aminopelargonate synthetase-like enzyme